mmetsp:Transcript_13245/g.31457  ORF Transcript_13245/g.31457 Transcript_13245/m.31457 type:complete len:313 (-) Transcript_13245:5287-6225(-)
MRVLLVQFGCGPWSLLLDLLLRELGSGRLEDSVQQNVNDTFASYPLQVLPAVQDVVNHVVDNLIKALLHRVNLANKLRSLCTGWLCRFLQRILARDIGRAQLELDNLNSLQNLGEVGLVKHFSASFRRPSSRFRQRLDHIVVDCEGFPLLVLLPVLVFRLFVLAQHAHELLQSSTAIDQIGRGEGVLEGFALHEDDQDLGAVLEIDLLPLLHPRLGIDILADLLRTLAVSEPLHNRISIDLFQPHLLLVFLLDDRHSLLRKLGRVRHDAGPDHLESLSVRGDAEPTSVLFCLEPFDEGPQTLDAHGTRGIGV